MGWRWWGGCGKVCAAREADGLCFSSADHDVGASTGLSRAVADGAGASRFCGQIEGGPGVTGAHPLAAAAWRVARPTTEVAG